MTFSRTTLDLIITVKDTGDKVILQNQYVRDGAQGFAVESFVFSDRTIDYRQYNPENMDLIGTSGAETITGSDFGETLDGRAAATTC